VIKDFLFLIALVLIFGIIQYSRNSNSVSMASLNSNGKIVSNVGKPK
jgi:hypothetical protein